MNLDWLKTIAPTVATALGGPLAGVAVAAISKAFGWDTNDVTRVMDTLKTGALSGEDVVKLKIAEMDLQKFEQEQGFKFAELEVRDRESARNREAAVKDNTNAILAYTVVGSFIAMVAGTLLGYAKADTALAGTLIGYLSAKGEQVLAYYFGSSSGSSLKTRMLGAMGAKQ